MTIDDLVQIVRQSVISATGLADDKVIVYHPNAPRPVGAYATVNDTSSSPVDWGSFKEVGNGTGDLNRSYSSLNDVSFSINFYRETAMQYAALLSGYLVSQEAVDFWNLNEVGLASRSPTREISALIDTITEPRSQMDIVMQAVISPADQVIDAVHAVRIVGEVDNGVEVLKDVFIGPPLP